MKDPLILDLGGRRNLASSFFPSARCISLDPKGSPDVFGTGFLLPFTDGCFDFTIILDVLEHVDPIERKDLIFEAVRVTSSRLILGGPFKDDRISRAEKFLSDYTGLMNGGVPDRNLEEHYALGLPSLTDVKETMETAAGADVQILDGISLGWWLILMVMTHHMTRFGELASSFSSLIDVTRLRGRPSYNSFLSVPLGRDKGKSGSSKTHIAGWEPGSASLQTGDKGIEELAALLLQESRIKELESREAEYLGHLEALETERDALRKAMHEKDRHLAEHGKSLAEHRLAIEKLSKFRERILGIPGMKTALKIAGSMGIKETKG